MTSFDRLLAVIAIGLILAARLAVGQAQPERTIAVMLGNGRLQLLSSEGKLLREYVVAPAGLAYAPHVLAQSADGATLFALAESPKPPAFTTAPVGAQTSIWRISLRDGIATSRMLPSAPAYQALAIGPRTGAPYLAGSGDEGVVVLRLAPDSLGDSGRWVIRQEANASWTVYGASIDPLERSIYVSYHIGQRAAEDAGPLTGADGFALDSGVPIPCLGRRPPNNGCAMHGSVVALGQGIVAATGGAALERIGANGSVAAFNTGLEGNHLMEFAVDSVSGRVFAVGSCGYVGGFSSTVLPEARRVATDTNPTVVTPPRDYSVCGEELSVEPTGRWVVVARVASPPYGSAGPGELTLLDAQTGRVIRRIPIPEQPRAVLVLR